MGDEPAQPTPPVPENPVMSPPPPIDNPQNAMPADGFTPPLMTTTPPTSANPTPPVDLKPQVVAAGPGDSGSGNKLIMIVSAVVLVVVLGIFGAYFYLKSTKSAQTSPQPAVTAPTQVVVTPEPSPQAAEPTVNELVGSVDASMNGLDTDINSVDQGLADRQGDLSE